MKTINIVKGLQLKEVGNKIVLTFKGDIVSKWDNTPLNEYALIASAEQFKHTTTKKYFKEAYASQVGGMGSMRELFLWCKDDTNWEYKKAISILIDEFNPRFVEI